MILQALYDYYQRKTSGPDPIAPEGYEWKEIPFVIVIDQEGKFCALEDTREGEGRQLRAKKFLVPQGQKRTVGIKANLLWDNVEYALGANPRNRDDIAKRHSAFKERLHETFKHIENNVYFKALKLFFESSPIEQIRLNDAYAESWNEVLDGNLNVIFHLEGDPAPSICENLRNYIDDNKFKGDNDGICLITGESAQISRLHPAVKGVRGTNTAGGSIVSFNLSAFRSHGKKQNFNAPIGVGGAFSYTTALNIMLGKDSTNKMMVGDSTIIFWSEKKPEKDIYDLESNFSWFFADSPKDDPDRGIQAVRALYAACQTGRIPSDEGDRFYVLGLAPNAARIAVRFWKTGTISDFALKIKMHFDNFKIVRSQVDPEYLPLNRILRSTALEYKTDNIPPNLAGAVMESVLNGTPYPVTLLQQCVRRIRAERHVTRARAAILKAYLNRFYCFYKDSGKEDMKVSLDKNNRSQGYRLGRLFAVLEKIQEEANPGINATIRDRFYGAASSNPVTAFPQLLKLKNHHLAKLENPGRKIKFEKQLGEIFEGIEDFSSHLSMQEQARFAVGYYHQRQSFFEKTTEKPE